MNLHQQPQQMFPLNLFFLDHKQKILNCHYRRHQLMAAVVAIQYFLFVIQEEQVQREHLLGLLM